MTAAFALQPCLPPHHLHLLRSLQPTFSLIGPQLSPCPRPLYHHPPRSSGQNLSRQSPWAPLSFTSHLQFRSESWACASRTFQCPHMLGSRPLDLAHRPPTVALTPFKLYSRLPSHQRGLKKKLRSYLHITKLVILTTGVSGSNYILTLCHHHHILFLKLFLIKR